MGDLYQLLPDDFVLGRFCSLGRGDARCVFTGLIGPTVQLATRTHPCTTYVYVQ